jgi:hypothetical protein
MSEFMEPVNPATLTPGERATMDQRWALANEGCDLLVDQLRAHYATCQTAPPCVSPQIAHSFELLLEAGPGETIAVLHAALHRLAAPATDRGPDVS